MTNILVIMDTESKYKVIGITGQKFSGKDTLGDYFVNELGYTRIAFADALKEAVKCIFDFDDEQLYGSKKEIPDDYWNFSARQALQFVGTDLFRNQISTLSPHIEKNIWVHVVKRKILNRIEKDPHAKFVITDARFPNEIDMVKELGGIVIKLRRNNNNTDTHESEALIESLYCDYDISNNDTKENLYMTIKEQLNL